MRIRARLLNEMDIDISKWEFEDVTPGRQAFTIESVQAGSVTGVIACDQAAWINGRNLPANDGKKIEFTVRGNCANAKISAPRL